MILTIRTDKPEAELGLYDDGKQIDYITWQAHRNLSSDIHKKIKGLLEKNQSSFNNLTGIAFYSGPGSFTGLRIGATVANTMSDAQQIPIVGKSGENWINEATEAINDGRSDKITLPNYGALANTTKPKK